MEKTLVVLKPDAISRGLTGDVIKRFERAGLKIVGAKMHMVSREAAEKHYPDNRIEFLKGMGQKTLENYEKMGVDPVKELGTKDTLEIGKMIREWLIDYITSGPVIALVLEAPHAVELVRKICGHTLPLMSPPGTIRGDFAYDSSYLANTAKRAIKNLIHTSGSIEEAEFEVNLWFKPHELVSYERVEEKIMR
ncbi:MAG: nucleoside-diphosphate kinase [Candidatus Roizmanbacteria bacterium]|nr:MAG: nucleoside-diphosphate kinase [Candidatus Roizmanbacteria bacterium]